MKPSALFTFAAPSRFYRASGRFVPWLWIAAALFATAGLAIGLLIAPADAQQGEAYRIIFIHVPAAWLSMVVYLAMAGWAAVGWVLNARMAAMLARALAPTGMVFTLIALATGAAWGKPAWGAWWVWDARLTSELILLFLYLGYLALVAAIDDVQRADRAGALVAVIGAVNVPVIYFSVRWWNTLHQGASVSLSAAPKLASPMLVAMLLMTFAFWAYAFAVVFTRARAIVLERECGAEWVRRLRAGGRGAGRMNWRSAAEFFAMGGYAPYVWGAYGLTAALMAIETWLAARRRRRACAEAIRAPRAPEPHR